VKPRLTIELYYCPKAAPGYERSWLWRCTLPNGATRTCGSVRLFSLEETLADRKLLRWAKKVSA